MLAVTGTGALSLGAVRGDLIVKNGNGGTRVGAVDGIVQISAANGDVTIDAARQGATVKTANGSIRLGSIASGDVDLKTAFGTVEVGIAHGTAAKLDVKTTFGLLRQELEPSATPPASVRTATVKARTSHGDITIRRAARARARGGGRLGRRHGRGEHRRGRGAHARVDRRARLGVELAVEVQEGEAVHERPEGGGQRVRIRRR